MKTTLISHASVLIETSDCVIWCDPWMKGKAFNDSWNLLSEPHWHPDYYNQIDYLWISHEHPDHFHVPTLNSLPEEFKQRVVVLFQENNSTKIPDALRAFGFKHIKRLPHRKTIPLTPETSVYNCQIGQMDSVLAIKNKGEVVLNINDSEVNSSDCKLLLKDLTRIDVLLNQFSIAGYTGDTNYQKHLTDLKNKILSNVFENHQDLHATVTIPFASFVYFCTEDNKYINDYINTTDDVYHLFETPEKQCAILKPGDTYDTSCHLGNGYDSTKARDYYAQIYNNKDELVYDQPLKVELNAIAEAVKKRSKQMHEKYPRFILKRLSSLKVFIPDLNETVILCLDKGLLSKTEPADEYDLIIYSQPLHNAFDTTWGVQTLGVSGRYLIRKNKKIWKWYRILTSLNNAEIHLKPQYFFTTSNLNFIRSRLRGGLNQLTYQLKRMD